jgi:hypothetical protein
LHFFKKLISPFFRKNICSLPKEKYQKKNHTFVSDSIFLLHSENKTGSDKLGSVGFTLIARTSEHEVIRTSHLFCTMWVVTCDTYRYYLHHHLLMNSEWVMNQCWLVCIPVPNSIPRAGTTMNQMQVQSSGVQGSYWKHNKVVLAACCWEPELDCDFEVHDLWIFW